MDSSTPHAQHGHHANGHGQPAATGPVPAAQPMLEAMHVSTRRVLRRYLHADLETGAVATRLLDASGRHGRWWDVRPMLDLREHAPEVVDMAREALAVGMAHGLLVAHPAHPHCLRLAAGECAAQELGR